MASERSVPGGIGPAYPRHERRSRGTDHRQSGPTVGSSAMSSRLRLSVLGLASAAAAWCGALTVAPTAGADTASPTIVSFTWGNPGDTPLAGDWNGSGDWQI